MKLQSDLDGFIKETDRLLSLASSINGLDLHHRKLVSEIVHLRNSILIENILKSVFSKLCCNVDYLDGSSPALIVKCSSMSQAISQMKNLNRAKPVILKWNDGSEIRDNIKHVISRNDHCFSVLIKHASYLTEVRYVRNHVAHRNRTSRDNFNKIVKKHYGAKPRGVTCGGLLISPRWDPPFLEQYIKTGRAVVKELVRA